MEEKELRRHAEINMEQFDFDELKEVYVECYIEMCAKQSRITELDEENKRLKELSEAQDKAIEAWRIEPPVELVGTWHDWHEKYKSVFENLEAIKAQKP